jgi:predicted HAD superfamily Cof-like phosphohydrolase
LGEALDPGGGLVSCFGDLLFGTGHLLFQRGNLFAGFGQLVSQSDRGHDSQALVANLAKSAAQLVDALIDLCVVAIGTLNAFDVDSEKAWAAVYDANIVKKVGIKESRPNPLGLPDLIKPEGWTAPSHADNVGLLGHIFTD